jgi:hypothetical protein
VAEPGAGKSLGDRVPGRPAGEQPAGGEKLSKERVCGAWGKF